MKMLRSIAFIVLVFSVAANAQDTQNSAATDRDRDHNFVVKGNLSVNGSARVNGDVSAGGNVSGSNGNFAGDASNVDAILIGHSSNAENQGIGLLGISDTVHSDFQGTALGVFGTSASDTGTGVLGFATGCDPRFPNSNQQCTNFPGGATIGVRGLTLSATGFGMRGEAHAATGGAVGVEGDSHGESGVGVVGFASGCNPNNPDPNQQCETFPGGFTTGVRGISLSPTGSGVRGEADSTTGTATGVEGDSDAASGTGVLGFARATTGNTIGVRGISASSSFSSGVDGELNNPVSATGAALFGIVNSPTGASFGLIARNLSNQGTAGQFEAVGGGDIIVGLGLNFGRRFRVDNAGNVFAAGTVNSASGLADVAERIDSTDPLQAGDVVEIDPAFPDHFRKVKGAYSTMVAGIVSTAPAFTLANNGANDGKTADTRPLLALVGRVPAKVTNEAGVIRPGDLLTSSSTPGYAMRCADRNACAGAIIGKALQANTSARGTIDVLVTLQ